MKIGESNEPLLSKSQSEGMFAEQFTGSQNSINFKEMLANHSERTEVSLPFTI